MHQQTITKPTNLKKDRLLVDMDLAQFTALNRGVMHQQVHQSRYASSSPRRANHTGPSTGVVEELAAASQYNSTSDLARHALCCIEESEPVKSGAKQGTKRRKMTHWMIRMGQGSSTSISLNGELYVGMDE
ncbi:hypothetical protein VHEMI02265 [[Torrubiella] hemipterigena]|uniref:Uncharacterized protein n=1 Tax=[Torrubiella] hemipterigena TaxID=1531966 RepID=A0A0A1SP70_9HYPO|nr:hypothetical protein VHEMI02265 [[Torrubiella] hemipterigena]